MVHNAKKLDDPCYIGGKSIVKKELKPDAKGTDATCYNSTSCSYFFESINKMYPHLEMRRFISLYLTVFVFEVVFGRSANKIRNDFIYPACQMAFGKKLTLAPTLVSYLITEEKSASFMVRE